MAAKKTKSKTPSKKTAPSKVNKSAFIREHADKPPQEILRLAKSKGIELSIAMVYTILSEYRKRQGKGKIAKPSKASKVKTPPSSHKPSGTLEAMLIDAVVDLGGKTVQELLQAAISRVKTAAKKK